MRLVSLTLVQNKVMFNELFLFACSLTQIFCYFNPGKLDPVVWDPNDNKIKLPR